MKTIKLPVGGIVLELTESPTTQSGHDGKSWLKVQGSITSELSSAPTIVSEGIENYQSPYDSAINGLESLILAHACAGIDVSSPAYVEGIQTAIDAITNNLE